MLLAIAVGLGLEFAAESAVGEGSGSKIFTGEVAPAKGWLQLLSFIATIYVAIVALYALRFAREQAVEAANSRASTLYSELLKTWDDQRFSESRKLIQGLETYYEANRKAMPTALTTLDDYIAEALLLLRESDKTLYNKYTHQLDALEYIGLLCRRRLMDEEGVFEIFGGQIVYARNRLRLFCRRLQEVSKETGYPDWEAVYANALWLFSRASDYIPFRYPASQDQ